MGDFFARLTDPPVLAQLFAVLIAVLVAIAAAGALRAWHRRRRGPRRVPASPARSSRWPTS